MAKYLIVFVCTGNVCRSPMAELLFRTAAGAEAEWETCSAGLAAACGVPASREAVEVMAERGVDLTAHCSRPLGPELVEAADLVVVMTGGHRSELESLYPRAKHKVYVLRTFDPEAVDPDIADPIGLTTDMYRKTCRDIAAAMPGLLEYLKGYTE